MESEHDSQIEQCLIFAKTNVQYIQEETYNLLKEDKYADDVELHAAIYKIHQKAHDITKVIDTYF